VAGDELSRLREVLTERQARWAEAYVRGVNATESARQAGYSGNDNALGRQGYDCRTNPKIRTYLDALRRHLNGGGPGTMLERVRDRLAEIAMGVPQEQFVRGEVVMMPPRLADQRGALRTLAQMLGGLDPRTRYLITPGVRAELEALHGRMSDAAYVEMLEAIRDLAETRGETQSIEAHVLTTGDDE
jgi:hypothetical protein